MCSDKSRYWGGVIRFTMCVVHRFHYFIKIKAKAHQQFAHLPSPALYVVLQCYAYSFCNKTVAHCNYHLPSITSRDLMPCWMCNDHIIDDVHVWWVYIHGCKMMWTLCCNLSFQFMYTCWDGSYFDSVSVSWQCDNSVIIFCSVLFTCKYNICWLCIFFDRLTKGQMLFRYRAR